MKHFLIAGVLAVASVVAIAQDAARTIELHVDGLVCAFCAQGITKKLSKLDATSDVLVSLESGLVAVALKPGADIADEVLRAELTDAGYAIARIERKDESLDDIRARLKAKP